MQSVIILSVVKLCDPSEILVMLIRSRSRTLHHTYANFYTGSLSKTMPYHSLNKNSIDFLHTSLSHYAIKRRYGHLLKKKKRIKEKEKEEKNIDGEKKRKKKKEKQ
jgi:hypothetical protein